MKATNHLMPPALQAVRDHLLQSGKVASEFNGYIASFGASIKQCGLPVTVAMFSRSDRSEQDKKKLLNALYQIVKVGFDFHPTHDEGDLLSYFEKHTQDYALMQYRIELSTVALKLAVRTFPQTKD
jgi:CRISPR-associated protein Cmr5